MLSGIRGKSGFGSRVIPSTILLIGFTDSFASFVDASGIHCSVKSSSSNPNAWKIKITSVLELE